MALTSYLFVCFGLMMVISGVITPSLSLEHRYSLYRHRHHKHHHRLPLPNHTKPAVPLPHHASPTFPPHTMFLKPKSIPTCENNRRCPKGLSCVECLDGTMACLKNPTGVCCGCTDENCWTCPRKENCQLNEPDYCDANIDIVLSPLLMAMVLIAIVVILLMIMFACSVCFGAFDKEIEMAQERGPAVVVITRKSIDQSSGKGEVEHYERERRRSSVAFPSANAPNEATTATATTSLLLKPVVKYTDL